MSIARASESLGRRQRTTNASVIADEKGDGDHSVGGEDTIGRRTMPNHYKAMWSVHIDSHGRKSSNTLFFNVALVAHKFYTLNELQGASERLHEEWKGSCDPKLGRTP